jgi:hypothetical protein
MTLSDNSWSVTEFDYNLPPEFIAVHRPDEIA